MNYEKKFTPGPWEYDRNGVYTQKQIMGNVICESPIYLEDSYKNWEANAKLIAAAPELFEACIAALEHHQGFHSEIGNKLRNAIKKATE